MEALQQTISIDQFFRRLAAAGRGLLMLDYDGTLAPFHQDPASAVPYQGVPEALDRILGQGRTHLAIVTGRSLAQGLPMPQLSGPVEVWAAHGHERRRVDGRCESRPLPPGVIEALVTVDDWIDEATAAGARCERKPASVAFHWRGQPPDVAARLRETIRLRWNQADLGRVLRWLDFDCGVEVAAPNGTKGKVVDVLFSEHGRIPAAFLGDDYTDEDAFLSIRERGIGVLVRREQRVTSADFWCQPPGDLLEFLARWHTALGQGC
jgi:trehalose-phosphatase